MSSKNKSNQGKANQAKSNLANSNLAKVNQASQQRAQATLSAGVQMQEPEDKSDTSHIRVGELLTEAQIVSTAEMTEAIQVSKRLGIPIGRVLTMSGLVGEGVLESALQVQQLIRAEDVPLNVGINSLRRVHQTKVPLAEALAEEDFIPDLENDPHKLAALLVDSNIVSSEQMERAVQASSDQGVPLGSTLVLHGFLSEAVLPSLIRIQQAISEGDISREDGLREIRETFVLWIKADESLKTPLKTDEPVSRPVHQAPDQSLMQNQSHQSNQAHQSNLAHQAQAYQPAPPPTNQVLSQGYNAQGQPQAHGQSQAQSNAQPASPVVDDISKVRLVDLLKHAGVFSQADVQKRYDTMLKDPVRSARFFMELGLVDEADVKIALRSHSLMQRGTLTRDEAAAALRDARVDTFARELIREEQEGQAANLSNDMASGMGTDISADNARRNSDKERRGQMGKVIGGALFGALVAGFTMSKRK